ncbi:hypothetical protein B0T10DRAFT_68500 [Thelonectria olida]|uniref:Uncharacterized protein n=1 Tax=Thelonectria olida TaxID=1576542 RepID=A0A9P9ARS5_9HYPO|nr:hypothetical protein B0T10DRAFT_68500 [Thelonectria olida]
MASTIVVDREVPVSSGNGVTRPRATSNYSLFNHQPEPTPVNIPQLRPRAKSSSNLGVHLEPKFEFDDHTLIDEEGNYKRRYGVAELIDFLKNHPPPADNFMSIPDARKDDDKGKWAKIRKLAKRSKSTSFQSPDPIRLPDSAISGLTTGGHRHIAISIPLDASPFGRTPRSQYPVYSIRGVKGPSSRYGPTRAVLNEKGVVTVLRTVNEESESPVTKKPAQPRDRSSAPARTRSRSCSSPMSKSHSRANSTNSNGRGKVSEYFGVSSSPPRAVPADQFKRANDASRDLHNYGQSQSLTTASNVERKDGSLPIRGSSLVASRFVFPPTTSIDAMMKETTPASDATQAAPSQSQSSPKDASPLESSSSVANTTTKTTPISPEPKQTKSPAPLEEAPVILSSKTMTEEMDVTVITKSPIPRGDGHISPTPSAASSQDQSRRQKVRDKKRRDIEALRSSKRQSQQSEPDTPSVRYSKGEEIEVGEETPTSPERKTKPPPLPLRSPSRQSLCAIVVNSDVQPSPPPSDVPQSPADESQPPQSPAESSLPAQSPVGESRHAKSPSEQIRTELGLTQVVAASPGVEPPLASPPLDHGFPKPPKVKPQFRPKPIPRIPSQSSVSKPIMTSPVVSFNSSNNPTPPASVKGSPAQGSAGDRTSKRSSVDRTSKQSTVSVDRSSKQSSIEVDRTSKQSFVEQHPSKQGSIDRSSAARRREWNATREQDRRGSGSRVGSRSLPKPLVLSMEDKDPEEMKSALSSERDVIRRYDVYREYRIREMERRVRRLERNGDIWLRAIVPVLENLNRTLSGNAGRSEDRERARGWVSDEDLVGSLSPPRGRSSLGLGSRRSRMMPQAGASEREFLEHLVRTKEELEAGNISDDLSGFDTIEPLMRELAGRSRLSFEARSMALAEDDEAMFRGF